MKPFIAAILATSGLLAATAGLAQSPSVEDQLEPYADAMGMERGAVERTFDTVNVVEYTVSGTVTAPNGAVSRVANMKIGIDYVIPAIRTDWVVPPPPRPKGAKGPARPGVRKVEVASGNLAWDESIPGVYSGPASTPAADRIRLTCLTPHGIILAALVMPQTVRFGTDGKATTLTSACPLGGTIKTTMNADKRPAKIELSQNGDIWSTELSNYTHDDQGFEVFFPRRIREFHAGKLVADLTVTQGLPNPYMLFPVPSQVRPVASK